ncbi:dephospho-CoA kinase [Corynebacterium uberis]|uniref:dephospho-CoA kinase n=1 Tax=Corynebacterium TaxID=1716 RepID=UPI001D0B8FD3|nr:MULTISPECIES: dephospho-CoA kinase [Corynebacterium]MCZ9309147.1 dephospho-CoA kinase [Corynebacterium sp. c6VSa_13]UDL74391.1 dephospho-CoA kinase [Corynebacterium uberis]UDL76775.1 dephospho-CoA kinase [Corynebacterium uberis]UDL78988.1 dephospho-CoA kinase [Corynebacterium uberis]UDL81265.1 dephospho-CoA kinase [Corynebacterium uberis]
MIIGLTGGIGSGKTTVADLLRSHGFRIVDADQVAREIVAPGSPVLDQLAQAFGQDILDGDVLDRTELARRAFADPEHTELLNTITHPWIEAETSRQFADAGDETVIYDMPLLVEKGLHEDMDYVVVVDVDAEERVRRLVELRGLGEDDARRRIDAQVSDERRREVADFIIDNNGPVDALAEQVDQLVERISS